MDDEKLILIPKENITTNINSSRMSSKVFLSVRIIIYSLAFSFVFLNTLYGFVLPHGDIKCISDELFNLSSPLNNYFKENVTQRNILLITSSVFIDFVVIFFSIIWTFKGHSYRPILAFVLFYSFRILNQNLFQMQYPEGYLWQYPGFPSIVVSYLGTNDFFYSGHVGFPIIVGMELWHLDYRFMFYFCIMSSVFEAFVMIVLRGHYSIDLMSGIIFAHYAFITSEKYCYILDNSCISMNKHLKIEKTDREVEINKID